MTDPTDPTELRLKLKAQGYHPIPVASPLPDPKTEDEEKIGKFPLDTKWPRWAGADEATIRGWWGEQSGRDALGPNAWRPHGNTGLICGALVAVDIDVLNPVLAERIAVLADEMLGITPLHRVGQAPKIMRLYRNAGGPLPKLMTPPMLLGDLKVQVEVLGQGQQCVAFGIHPGTRQAYHWTGQAPRMCLLRRCQRSSRRGCAPSWPKPRKSL